MRVYRDLYLKHGRSEEALCWSKNKQENRFEALTRHIPNSASILLDYGCGLGDLKTWLSTSKPLISYRGVDIVPEFIESNKKALGAEYFSTITGPEDVAHKFDHGILSGVFNLRTLPEDIHWTLLQKTLTALFMNTRISLAIDFLSWDVDFKKENSYHQNPDSIGRFISQSLSRRWELNKSYLPYEYSVVIFKDVEIDSTRNVYANSLPIR